MLLSEYNAKDISQKQLVDIMVQIMNIYLNTDEGHGAVCPENIMIDSDGVFERLGIVSFTEKKGYSDRIYPVGSAVSEEKNDVFCLGITATYLLGGAFDLIGAELLLLQVEEDKPFVLCEPVKKGSELCGLISSMTDLNTKTRPSMSECLKTIVCFGDGEAEVEIIDKNTGGKLESIPCRLNAPVHEFHPRELYEFNRRRYIPVSMPQSGSIPVYYSVFPYKIPFYVTLDRPNPDSLTVSRKAERLCIGIDFGTFSSSASYIDDSGRTRSILFDGTDYIPSAVFFNSETDLLFGSDAVREGMKAPECLFTEIKRTFCGGGRIGAVTRSGGTEIGASIGEIVTEYLSYLKSEIEKTLGDTQNARYVMTVPACYDPGQKTALYESAKKAGIDPDILTEPEAAAIYFGATAEPDRRIMVFDLGGGTVDVSILTSSANEDGVSYRIKRRSGDEKLGGMDMTNALCRHLCKKVYKKNGINTETDSAEEAGLDERQFAYNKRIMAETAEKIKCELSRYDRSAKVVELYRPGSVSKSEVKVSCEREDYETNVIDSSDLIPRMISSVGRVITECGYTPDDIDELIITGGAAQTPIVLRKLTEFFNGHNCLINYIDHFSAISKGAAIYANILETNDNSAQVLSETEYDLGLLVGGRIGSQTVFRTLIPAGTPFADGAINICTECSLTERERTARFCRLVLYRRPRGFENVNSPLEYDGDVIRPIGVLYVDSFPEEFDPEKGKVSFSITLNSQECISSNIAFFMPEKTPSAIRGKKELNYVRVGLCTALFVPGEKNE